MSKYNEIRLRGNPVAAFAFLRQQDTPPRELTIGERLAKDEAIAFEEERRVRVQRVREGWFTFRSAAEFFSALRRAQAGEEIKEIGGGE